MEPDYVSQPPLELGVTVGLSFVVESVQKWCIHYF